MTVRAALLPTRPCDPLLRRLPRTVVNTHLRVRTSKRNRRGKEDCACASARPTIPQECHPSTPRPRSSTPCATSTSSTGTGELVPPQKFYTVRYTGWLTDGTKFDSSYDHPGQEPITFFDGAHRVIPGWDTGFTGMRVGGKRRLYIPYQLAYGESGREGAIPPKADLIFDIELVSFSDYADAACRVANAVPPTQAQPDTPTAQPSTNPN